MVCSRLLSYFSLLVIPIYQATAQTEFLTHYCLSDEGNYTANSTYQNNLNALLMKLSSNTEIDYGFYNFSYGKDSDIVNTIGLCRGDLKPQDCRSCLNDSRVLLTQQCPNQKEAIVFHYNCMLRYSNRSIFGIVETSPWDYSWAGGNATEVDQFDGVLMQLLNGTLRSKAASGDALRKFAVANEIGPNFQNIYALVQCTPDLSEQDCNDCLAGAFSEIPKCCHGQRGVSIMRPSCNFRYENYRFYGAIADTPPLPPAPSNMVTPIKGQRNTLRTIIIAVSVAALVILLAMFIYIYLRKMTAGRYSDTEAEDEIEVEEPLQFDFDTIRVATNDFSDVNKLGEGGFGPVYKGKLSNRQEIAVKRLSRASGQGDMEFKNEVMLVAKLQHRNLVRLLGFCLERRERLLVYEFVPNKSLNYFIYDPTKHTQLNWERRYKIIEGIARGILYLHEDSRFRIIHRDLKLSNILLDHEMKPKISDFGTARMFVEDQTQSSTSKIVGTFGYMAPEYVKHGHFSVKSDVFSFGVMVLEIVSGRKNGEFCHEENAEDLLSFAWKNWREGIIANIIDPSLNDGSRNEIMRCIHIGLLCVQENIADRPTMASVVLMLNSYSVVLPVPLKPAFYMHSISLSDGDSRENNSMATWQCKSKNNACEASANEASISDLSPR